MSPLFGRGPGDADDGPRSSDERERARRDREARRAAREGRPAPVYDDPPPPPTPPSRRSSGEAVPAGARFVEPDLGSGRPAPGQPIEPDWSAAAFRVPEADAPDRAAPPSGAASSSANPSPPPGAVGSASSSRGPSASGGAGSGADPRDAPTSGGGASASGPGGAPTSGGAGSGADPRGAPTPGGGPLGPGGPAARSGTPAPAPRDAAGSSDRSARSAPTRGGQPPADDWSSTQTPPATPSAADPPAPALRGSEAPRAPAPPGPAFDVEPTVSRRLPTPDPHAWNEPDDEPEFDFGRRPAGKRRRWRRGQDLDDALAGPDDEPAVRVQRAGEAPVGVKRVPASAVATAAGAAGPPRFGAPPRGVPKSRRGLKRALPVLGLLVVLLIAYAVVQVWQPGKGGGKGSVVVVIPRGSGVSQIGKLLAKNDVVAHGYLFEFRALLSGDNDKLRTGPIGLKHDMSYAAAIKALVAKPGVAAQAPPTTKLTLPEGPSRKESVAAVTKAGVTGSYLAATRSSPSLDPRDYGAPKRTPSLEGFLFPATYDIRVGASATSLVSQQLKAFKQQFGTLDLAYAKSKKLTRYDVLIIASMIEREASVAKDRPLIAAVIYNRLKLGMPLGIDATIRYKLSNWTKPLTVSELNTKSAYNTRLNQGLPPTPIGNPGLASLQAAAHPAKVNYLYYVVKVCGHGAHAFASTNAKFNADVARYKNYQATHDGKDPANC